MGDESANIRRERIERLLRELKYEITRGVMEREIEPRMGMEKIIPGGPTGYVTFRLDVRPSDGRSFAMQDQMPRLRVVGSESGEGQSDG